MFAKTNKHTPTIARGEIESLPCRNQDAMSSLLKKRFCEPTATETICDRRIATEPSASAKTVKQARRSGRRSNLAMPQNACPPLRSGVPPHGSNSGLCHYRLPQ